MKARETYNDFKTHANEMEYGVPIPKVDLQQTFNYRIPKDPYQHRSFSLAVSTNSSPRKLNPTQILTSPKSPYLNRSIDLSSTSTGTPGSPGMHSKIGEFHASAIGAMN
jgi:hypothetical protein